MVTKQEVEELKQAEIPWDSIAQIQCTKHPDIVKSAKLLAEVGHDAKGKRMKGQ